jgi:hypothetical protein
MSAQPRIVVHVLPQRLAPEPALYPAALGEAVSAAARWGDEEL